MSDKLAPGRGLIYGLLLGILLWLVGIALIFGGR
jgi:hypothetical protein